MSIPQIKLDFSAIKKKNGNTEFVLYHNNTEEQQSLKSSDEDENEDEDEKDLQGV